MKKGKYNVNLEAIYRLQIKRKKETKSRRNSEDKGRQGERNEPLWAKDKMRKDHLI